MKAVIFYFFIFKVYFASYIGKYVLEIIFLFFLFDRTLEAVIKLRVRISRWSFPPKSRKITDSLSESRFLISRTYCFM